METSTIISDAVHYTFLGPDLTFPAVKLADYLTRGDVKLVVRASSAVPPATPVQTLARRRCACTLLYFPHASKHLACVVPRPQKFLPRLGTTTDEVTVARVEETLSPFWASWTFVQSLRQIARGAQPVRGCFAHGCTRLRCSPRAE